jgi:hypothetical protein
VQPGRFHGRIEFAKVVAAAAQTVNVGRRHARHELVQLRIEIEKMRLIVCAVVRTERLVPAVDRRREVAQQRVVLVAGE